MPETCTDIYENKSQLLHKLVPLVINVILVTVIVCQMTFTFVFMKSLITRVHIFTLSLIAKLMSFI